MAISCFLAMNLTVLGENIMSLITYLGDEYIFEQSNMILIYLYLLDSGLKSFYN